MFIVNKIFSVDDKYEIYNIDLFGKRMNFVISGKVRRDCHTKRY